MSEEYELFPVDEISKLKEELKGLKNKPFTNSSEGNNLLSAVTELSETMTNMMDLFKSAADSVKSEGSSHEKILANLDKVVDQNTKIAKALIGIADLIKQKEKFIPNPPVSITPKSTLGPMSSRLESQPIPYPSQITNPGLGPESMPPFIGETSSEEEFPPLPSSPNVMPPPPPKKKGFFSKFKK